MTYEYECPMCHAITEAERAIADRNTVPACRVCGGSTARRLSRPTLVLGRLHESDAWRDPLSRTDRLEQMRQGDRLYEAGFQQEDDFGWMQTQREAEETDAREAFEEARQ